MFLKGVPGGELLPSPPPQIILSPGQRGMVVTALQTTSFLGVLPSSFPLEGRLASHLSFVLSI